MPNEFEWDMNWQGKNTMIALNGLSEWMVYLDWALSLNGVLYDKR